MLLSSKCIIKYVGEVQDVEINERNVGDEESDEEDSTTDASTLVNDNKRDDGSFPFKFYVRDEDRNLIMAAQTYEEAREWIRCLKNAVNVEQYFDDSKKYRFQTPLFSVVRLLVEDVPTHELVLRNEWIAGDAMKALSDSVLKKNLVPISRLAIIECGLSDEYMISMGEGMGFNENIKELDLSTNRIGDTGVGELCDGLYLNVTVERLNLANNVVCDVGAVYLSDVIRGSVSITSLNLSQNHITPIGAASLSNALETNEFLVELELGNNDLGDEGCAKLAQGIKINKHLKKLGLSYNHIASGGLKTLCEEGLSSNRTLEELDLTGNDFDQKGAEALFNTLKDHKSLTKIDCGNNSKLQVDGITTLAQTLKSRFLVSELVMTRITNK
jgi:Ran GTPase-activating protein (RanGAP) involved in mRNA processing and transport